MGAAEAAPIFFASPVFVSACLVRHVVQAGSVPPTVVFGGIGTDGTLGAMMGWNLR